MWMETEVFHADMQSICGASFIPWDKLRNKSILVTGGTGLIGTTLICALLYTSKKKELGLTVTALVRDEDRARERFAEHPRNGEGLRFVVGSVEALPDIDIPVDYIIHGASQTASRAFVEQPVETVKTAVQGTMNLLELAKEKCALGFAYLSSMEVYGHPQCGHKVTEDEIGALSPLDIRNSYPISKMQCESLCCTYAKEYGVPAVILRLTQTFGPGVKEDDQRVFAEFGRCVREGRDIVLKTRGETERSYLYTADAVTAVLCSLLKGAPGVAYNAADDNTYCSIAEMARMVAEWGGVKVRYELEDEAANGYSALLYMDLDTSRLKNLGWRPADRQTERSVVEMYRRMMGK